MDILWLDSLYCILGLIFFSLSLINFTMFVVARNVISHALWLRFDLECRRLPEVYEGDIWKVYIEMLREQKGGAGKL